MIALENGGRMKSLFKTFLPGVILSAITSVLILSVYIGGLLYIAKPGFTISNVNPTLTSDQEHQVVNALVQLSHITGALGLERYTALFIGSAGAIAERFPDQASRSLANYQVLRSVELASSYGSKSGNFEPYFDAAINAAFVMRDLGDSKNARKAAEGALDLAKEKAPQSNWVNSLTRIVVFLDKNP
jgi:hypothetical protein